MKIIFWYCYSSIKFCSNEMNKFLIGENDNYVLSSSIEIKCNSGYKYQNFLTS